LIIGFCKPVGFEFPLKKISVGFAALPCFNLACQKVFISGSWVDEKVIV